MWFIPTVPEAYIWLIFPMPRIFQPTQNYIDEKVYLHLILFNLFFLNKLR